MLAFLYDSVSNTVLSQKEKKDVLLLMNAGENMLERMKL